MADTDGVTVSPMSLLQNPMILLAVVGFGLMIGMPYLIDSSMLTIYFYYCGIWGSGWGIRANER